MKLNIQNKFNNLVKLINDQIKADFNLDKATSGMSLNMGLSTDGNYDIAPGAMMDPIYVGCRDALGERIGSDELKTLAKTSPDKVQAKPRWNSATKKFDYVYGKGVTDADPFIPGQLFSPWMVNYFEDIFTKPLLYTNARKMCKVYSGNNPWAKVMSLFLADFAGFASYAQTGTVANNMTRDVSVKAGMMTSEVINMDVTYALQIEEQEMAKNSEYPFANKLMSMKPAYAKYVLDMLEAFLIYYGNTATETVGLLNVNAVTTWASVSGTSLKAIQADSGDTTKGSTAYKQLYAAIMDFLATSYNRFNVVNVALSPKAHNYLSLMPYSNSYNPTSVLAILKENLANTKSDDGVPIEVNFFSEPLLSESTIFNADVFDYMVITAPEVKTGTDDKRRDLILCGEPLDEFVYPVVPGQYLQQHKMLRRYAGIFAPVPTAIKAYSGYGVLS